MVEGDSSQHKSAASESQISREATAIVAYEVLHEVLHTVRSDSKQMLWGLEAYKKGADGLFSQRLIGTFRGLESTEDARRQKRLSKIVEKTKKDIVRKDGEIDHKHWAAKLHGAYLMSEVLFRIMPDSTERERRFTLLTETKMNSSDKTPLEELLFIDINEANSLDSTEKMELFMALLNEVEDIIFSTDTYYDELSVEY